MKKAAKKKVSRPVKPRSKPKNSLLLFAVLIIALVGFAVWAVITKSPGKTPSAASLGAAGLKVVSQVCNSGKVNATFNWTPQPKGAFFVTDQQWLDLSLINNNFTSSFLNTSNPPSKSASSYVTGQAGGQIGPLVPGKTHYWRINTHNSLNNTWYPSSVGTFTTITCHQWTLGQPTVNGTTAKFSISPAAGVGSILYIKDLAQSIPIPAAATSISWTGAVGAHSAVISAFGVDVSNTVSFSLISPPSVTFCTFTPQYVNVGSSVRVASDGYGLPVEIKNRFTGTVYSLNRLNGDNSYTDVRITTNVYPNPYDMYLKKDGGGTFPCTYNGDHLWVRSALTCKDMDFDNDGKISILDISRLASLSGTYSGQAKYNPVYDLNHDGKIDSLDLNLIKDNFGKTC